MSISKDEQAMAQFLASMVEARMRLEEEMTEYFGGVPEDRRGPVYELAMFLAVMGRRNSGPQPNAPSTAMIQ